MDLRETHTAHTHTQVRKFRGKERERERERTGSGEIASESNRRQQVEREVFEKYFFRRNIPRSKVFRV